MSPEFPRKNGFFKKLIRKKIHRGRRVEMSTREILAIILPESSLQKIVILASVVSGIIRNSLYGTVQMLSRPDWNVNPQKQTRHCRQDRIFGPVGGWRVSGLDGIQSILGLLRLRQLGCDARRPKRAFMGTIFCGRHNFSK